jgi:hypothetical protein
MLSDALGLRPLEADTDPGLRHTESV